MLDVLNINQYIKDKDLLEVRNPISFTNGEINNDGLYSPLIFGNTTQDKFIKFGYIKLGTKVIHPLIYKNLAKIKSIFFNITLDENHKNFKSCIIKDGMLEEVTGDAKGNSGINWLINNWKDIDLIKYKNGKNDNFIDVLIDKKGSIFIDNFLVIPVNYRQYVIEYGKLNEDEITGFYKQILTITKSGSDNDFVTSLIEIGGGKTTSIQKIVNKIYNEFILSQDKKKGDFRGKVISKRIDNITRLVANAQPNIPMDCCAIPWQNLLVMFDLFVIEILKTRSDEFLKKLGVESFGYDDFGTLFDLIFRHCDSYVSKYPDRIELWQDVLLDLFNKYKDIRVLLKRDPAWTKESYHCLKVIIIKDLSYHCVVNSLLYKPLGGDSFNSNYVGVIEEKNVFENNKLTIVGDNNIKVNITNVEDIIHTKGGTKWQN